MAPNVWRVSASIALLLALRLVSSAAAGEFEPSAPPAPTMKSLDEIPGSWSRAIDGPDRFKVVLGGDGVLDRETGLVWGRRPAVKASYFEAERVCSIAFWGSPARRGGRLPTRMELASLMTGSHAFVLADGHPFIDPPPAPQLIWTSTPDPEAPTPRLFALGLGATDFFSRDTSFQAWAWCVRGPAGF